MAKKKAARPKKQPCWLNKKNMAASIGISVQAFDKWNIEPVAKIGRETFYIVEDVIDFNVERALKNQEGLSNKAGSKFGEMLMNDDLPLSTRVEVLRAKKLELENHRLQLQNSVLEGRNLPAWAVTEVLSRILSRIGEILDGLPLKVKRKHPRVAKAVIEMIRSAVVTAQNESARISEYSDEIIDSVVAEAEERIR